jgi:hypothetical protein
MVGLRVRLLAGIASLSLVASGLGAITASATAAGATTPLNYTVSSTTDATGSCNVSACTSLRAAVTAANNNAGSTISLGAGTFTLTLGELPLTKAVTIQGVAKSPATGNSPTTISGNNSSRVFNISATGVTLDGLVITQGKAGNNNGGAIIINSGANVTLKRSTVSASSSGQGGGIEVDGTLTMTQSTVSANSSGNGKGGGLYVGGTATITESTIDGNSAKGGGAIASPGTTSIIDGTITANSSTNSNGGGLWRVGGTLNVKTSILAYNNGGTGRDCYGSPTFTGSNIIQNVSGCNPSGGTILQVDPLLAALADNGGATLTRWPGSGSPAIDAYALPCSNSIDQRGALRPSPTPTSNCDIGAVEVGTFAFHLSLSPSAPTIGVGVGSVPLKNIPPSALIPTPTSGGSTQSSTIKFNTIKFNTIKFNTIKFNTIKFNTIKFNTIKFNGVTPFDSIHLSDLTLDYPGGWDAILAGTPFANTPREDITLKQALPYIESAGVTLDQLDLAGSILGSVPFMAVLLGGVPMESIPLNGSTGYTTWCNALKTASQDPCTAIPVTQGDGTSLLGIALNGYSLDTIDPNSILVKDVASLDQGWFQGMPFSEFAKAQTSLANLPVSSFPAGYFTCLPGCSGQTLNQAALASGVNTNISLFDVFTNSNVTAIPTVAQFTLDDLMQGLFPPDLLPWPNLSLTATPLQNIANPLEPPLTYTGTATIADRAAVVNEQLTLPAGFVIVPGTYAVDGVAQPDPTVGANNVLSLSLGTLNPGSHTISIATRAGLNTGPATAILTGTAQAGATTLSDQSQATVTVKESFENGGSGGCSDLQSCDTKTVQPDTLYLGQISSPTDRDIYSFTVPQDGNKYRASIALANLPTTAYCDVAAHTPCTGDYDLVLYGPAPKLLRNPPTQTITPIDDTPVGVFPSDSAVAPDVQRDVPLVAPTATPGIVAISAQRGTTNETIDTNTLVAGATYSVQVSGYNGAWSPQPYSLRLMLLGATPAPCAQWQRSGSVPGALTFTQPSTNFGDANAHVLFVVPQRRMYQTYATDAGSTAAVTATMQKIQALATSADGVVLSVDDPGNGSTVSAYSSWDSNRCSADAANGVVSAIGQQIDAARAAYPKIDTLVLIGDDSVLPQARVPDGTQIANERSYAEVLQNNDGSDNELSGSLGDGYVLTDNAYATSAGVAVNGHELFLPDLAVGRLVETPQDISAAIDSYTNNGPSLDPSTAASALVTGYDFTTDGAQGVAANLAGVVGGAGNVDTSLISNSWSASDLLAKLFPAAGGSPGVVSFNGHFDQTRLLAGDQSTLLSTSQLPTNQSLLRHLLFSIGCHSGLSVSDVSIGPSYDWPQAITGQNGGGLWAASTGFGYGDDSAIALSERLMVLYAQALATDHNAAHAFAVAKQQYAATALALSPYDEKVLEESTFYGLPLWTVPINGGSMTSTKFKALQHAALAGLTVNGSTASFNTTAGGSLHFNHTNKGDYWDSNGQTITVQNRPIEPMTSLDVTDSSGQQRAHGVLITSLSSTDQASFHAKYFRPVVDQGSNERLMTSVGDAEFPAALGRVARGANNRDILNLALGQARSPQPDGTVTQRTFPSIGGLVEYSTSTSFTPPAIQRSAGEIVNSTIGFNVYTDPNARRVFVLYKVAGANGTWKGIDLTTDHVTLADGTVHWWGGGAIASGTSQAEFLVQAVDANGNVGVSDNKVSNFLATPLVGVGNLNINLSGGTPGANGWYLSGPVSAAVSPVTASTQISVDGAPFTAYTGPVSFNGDGVHHVLAQDGASFAAKDVEIDGTQPTVTATINAGGAQGTTLSGTTWYTNPVNLTIHGDDGSGSGVTSVAYSLNGGATTTVQSDTANTSATADGTYSYAYSATDLAGNTSSGSTAFGVDVNAPVVSCAPTTQPNSSGWYGGNVTVHCTSSDGNGSGLANAGDAAFDLVTTVAAGSASSTASTGTHPKVCDALGQCSKAIGPFGPYQVDLQKPTVDSQVTPNAGTHSATDVGGATWYDGPVALTINGHDGSGSGVASVSYSANGGPTQTVNGASTTISGISATTPFSYTATDNVGLTSDPGSTSVNIDTSNPVATCAPTTSANGVGWYATNVTVQCNVTDAGVGLANPGTDASFTLTTSLASGAQDPAATTNSHPNVCDLLSHCINVGPFHYPVDEQAPTVSGIIAANVGTHSATDAGGGTWYDGPVGLTITGTDGNGSGVASITYNIDGGSSTTLNVATTTFGNISASHVYGFTATDNVGLTSASGSATVNIDTAAPVVSCNPTTSPNSSGWYATEVTVQCTSTDSGVGLAHPSTDASFTLTTSVGAGNQNPAAPTTTHAAVCDLLGHCTPVNVGPFKVDRKGPSITVTTPAQGAVYVPGSTVAASYTCSDGNGSGVPAGNCVGTVANGAAIDTTGGMHSFTVTATDAAGNQSTAAVTYNAGFSICLLYDPTKAQPASGTMVIKLRLCDSQGNNLSSPNITLTAISINGSIVPPPNFQGNANNGNLFRYDPQNLQYIYNLDPSHETNPLGPGSYTFQFTDSVTGTQYSVPFKLK